MGRRTRARECAFQMLYTWDRTRAPLERVTRGYWRLRTTTDETRARAETLLRGAQAEIDALDALVERAATRWRLDRIAAVDLCILRLATYELLRETHTPAAVVIDEAVELAKRFGDAGSPAFVNGVLDAVRRGLRGEAPPRRVPPRARGARPAAGREPAAPEQAGVRLPRKTEHES